MPPKQHIIQVYIRGGDGPCEAVAPAVPGCDGVKGKNPADAVANLLARARGVLGLGEADELVPYFFVNEWP